MIEIKNLSFGYNKKVQVLKNVSFKADYGDFLAILGKNGVGKSTLMKCVVNGLKVSSGEILIDGTDITKIKSVDKAKLISYVPQEIHLGSGTAYDAILIGRKPYITYGVREHDLDVVDEIIKKLNLSDIAFKNVNNLSGGERQKVAIARALVQEPKLLYLDEPTSNLDIKNQLEVLDLLKDIAHQENITVLVNIHNISLAIQYFEKLILLKDGSVYKIVNEQNELLSSDIKDIFDVDIEINKTVDDKKYIIIKEKNK